MYTETETKMLAFQLNLYWKVLGPTGFKLNAFFFFFFFLLDCLCEIAHFSMCSLI